MPFSVRGYRGVCGSPVALRLRIDKSDSFLVIIVCVEFRNIILEVHVKNVAFAGNVMTICAYRSGHVQVPSVPPAPPFHSGSV